MQVCGLVESALGIAKDASGGFGSEQVFDRFLRNASEALSIEECEKGPAEKRKAVEDTASELGLIFDELREKMLEVTNTQSGGHEANDEQVFIEVVNGNASSCSVVPQSNGKFEVDVASSSEQAETTAIVSEKTKYELKLLKKKLFQRKTSGHWTVARRRNASLRFTSSTSRSLQMRFRDSPKR